MRKQLFGQSVMWVLKKGIIQQHMPQLAQLKVARALAVAQGALVEKRYAKNLIVNVGKAMIGDLLIGDETIGLGFIGIGTDNTTPAVGDTTLGTEVSRKAFALMERTGSVVSLSAFFPAADCTYHFYEVGIFGGTGASLTLDSGKLFSHYLQEYDNSGGTYDITFDYSLTIG